MDVSEDYGNYSYESLEYGETEDWTQSGQRDTVHTASVVIYCISFVLGLIGNGLVIWVTAFQTKQTVNSVWLLNLALADFVFISFLPFSIDYLRRDFTWNFGVAMCKINSFVTVVNMYASVLFVTVLSLDRYVSLVHLNWSRKRRTVKWARGVCVGVWALAFALSLPVLVFRDTVEHYGRVVCFNNFHSQDGHVAAKRHMTMVLIRTVVGFLLPFSTITMSGLLLACKIRRSAAAIRVSSFSRTASAVILAFFLCWAPFHVFSLMELSIHSSQLLNTVLHVGFPLVTSLAFFNSCVNPVLYVLLGKKVRRLLKHSCLDITKSSLRELNQSLSATESLSAALSNPGTTAQEPMELTPTALEPTPM